MKKYTVELVKRASMEDIEAINAKMAIQIAREQLWAEDYDVEAVIDQEAQEDVEICESCGGDILPDTDYSVSEDDGYSVCEKCTKEAQS